jgi:hypothetical protein
MNRILVFASALIALAGWNGAAQAQAPALAGPCPYDPSCIDNPYGAGSPFAPDGVNNPYSRYGSPYSNQSVRNPYATEAPRLYDRQGRYRGRLGANRYDPDSVSNPYGRYGSPYSHDSVNNPYGAGNPYRADPLYVVPGADPYKDDPW